MVCNIHHRQLLSVKMKSKTILYFGNVLSSIGAISSRLKTRFKAHYQSATEGLCCISLAEGLLVDERLPV